MYHCPMHGHGLHGTCSMLNVHEQWNPREIPYIYIWTHGKGSGILLRGVL